MSLIKNKWFWIGLGVLIGGIWLWGNLQQLLYLLGVGSAAYVVSTKREIVSKRKRIEQARASIAERDDQLAKLEEEVAKRKAAVVTDDYLVPLDLGD